MLWLVRSAVLILYPATDALPGVKDCGVNGFVKMYRREAPFLVWLGTVAGALVFHLTPLFTVFVPLPAFLLPARLADKHAARITGTSVYLVRQSVFLVKMCAGFCWGADPKVRARFNLPPLIEDPRTWRQS